MRGQSQSSPKTADRLELLREFIRFHALQDAVQEIESRFRRMEELGRHG